MNANKKHMVTSDFYEQCQKDWLFYEYNVLNNEEYEGYDILVNIDTNEQRQITGIVRDLKSHEERYNMSINLIGINRIVPYFPLKSREELLEKVEDIHLNGKYQRTGNFGGLIFDRTHSVWMDICRDKKLYQKLKKLGIINSISCWTSIVKQAMRLSYNITDEDILNR